MQIVYIDLIPQKIKPVVMASQFDDKRHVRFRLTENGEDYTLSGTETVTITIRKPDRNIVVITPAVTAANYIDVYFTEQACACFGVSFGEITIDDDNSKIGTCNFDLEVELSPAFGGIDSATEIDNLETQIEEIVTDVLSENYYTKSQTDNLLDAKANSSDVYSKSQTDTLLDAKANTSDVYSKTQTDTLLDAKANTSDVYTKSQTDNLLDAKANASDVYTKSQTDNLLNAKANASDVYTKTEVDNKILDIMPVDTESGPIASFVTELDALIVNVLCNVLATGGNGTPDNPNPINGYSSANITRCGVNLWDEEVQIGTINSDGTINTSVNNRLVTKNYIPVIPNTTYYMKWGNYGRGRGAFYDQNKNLVTYNSDFYRDETFTTPANAYYMMFSPSTDYGTTYNNDMSINYPSSDTSYHAYNGTTHVISFGQTVYGGVLDVTRGKLRVTHAFEIFTISGYSAKDVLGSYVRYRYNLANSVKENDTNQLCNLATYVLSYSSDTLHFYCANTTATFFRAYAFLPVGIDESGTVEFCYPLETPFDIDLTPVQIRALVGVNNVYSDTNGNTTVKFKDSIQHYIDTHTGG